MYVRLGAVNTYYEVDGAGEPLLLLHPGGADSRANERNVPALRDHFRVYRMDRRGHGRTADVDGPITHELMARDTIAFLEEVVGGAAHLVGHSDGAGVALTVALLRPDLVRSLVFAAGVWHHEGWRPGAIDLDPEVAAWFPDWYAEVSPDGREHFDVFAAKLDAMHRSEPAFTRAELAGYGGPALVMIGDREDEIDLAHMLELRDALPDAGLSVVSGCGHGLIAEKPELCGAIILDFLT